MPRSTSADACARRDCTSSGRTARPAASKRSSTSTTASYSGSGRSMCSAKRSGRACVPMVNASAKPRVINRAVGTPLRSKSALVARVVPNRMANGGRSRGVFAPVASCAASIGASEGERSSNRVPGAHSNGRSKCNRPDSLSHATT